MWNDPMPSWRTARKQHQCQGDGCVRVIASGERYLDRLVRDPENSHSHLRYCQECAGPVLDRAKGFADGRNKSDFPDRYQQRISSAQWQSLKREIVAQRGSRCERCNSEGPSLDLHHLHYRSVGNEHPEDVVLLCRDCHAEADKTRSAKRPQRDDPMEGLIVGPDGDHWGKLDPDAIYLVLPDGRYLPAGTLRNKPV